MAKHPELVGDFLHVPGYVQATDPGAVGGGKLWIDTSAGSGSWQTKIRNAANTAWEAVSGGGAGATNFPGLSDTPANYVGAANYKVVVNGTESGLIFIPDSGGGSFLPLAGGVMTGDIDFANANDGIRFDDGAGVKFDGMVFDPTEPEIIIGEVAPDVGGKPTIRANTPVFRVGAGAGAGFAVLEMWNQGAGGYEPVIQSISDNPGDPLDLSTGDHATNIQGSETRPTYNGADLALFTDVGGPAFPHENPGVGDLNFTSHNGILTSVSGTGADTGIVSVWDFIKSIRGGAAVPVWTFTAVAPGGGVVSGSPNADPKAITIAFGQVEAGGLFPINLTVDDGVTTRKQQTFVQVSDTDSW